MSFVQITAEKANTPVLIKYQLSTESQDDPDSDNPDDEIFRGVLRVVIGNEAQNVTNVSTPTSTLTTTDELNVRFNNGTLVTLYPLQDTSANSYGFRLVDQDYTPFSSKGSTFFSGTLEYVSVTPWESLSWG